MKACSFVRASLPRLLRTSVLLLALVFLANELDARGGGSFGGSRGGGGGSRGGGSFGGSRGSRGYSSPSPSYRPSTPPRSQNSAPSFGGSRGNSSLYRGSQIGSAQEYTRSYGTPRRQESTPYTGADGVSRNYQFNHYGGYSDGLMTGYALGRIPWMWYTPFHPAFYYSAPPYVVRPDGGVDYYPPTFSYGKLFFIIMIVGVGCFIVYVVIRNRRRRMGLDVDLSQSSFN